MDTDRMYDPDAPPRVEKPPPGMVWALAPNGDRVLAYLPPIEEPAPLPERTGVRDKWPARMLAGGASTSAVLGVIGHYGPGLSQAGHAAQMTGMGVGAAAAGLGALVLLIKGSLGGGSRGQNVNVSVNVSAHGGSARSSSQSRN